MNVHRDKKTGSKMGDFFGNVVSIRTQGQHGHRHAASSQTRTGSSRRPRARASSTRRPTTSEGRQLRHAERDADRHRPVQVLRVLARTRASCSSRNPYYKGKKYPWDKIVFPVIPDEQARLLALQSGQIDGTFAVPNNTISTLAEGAEPQGRHVRLGRLARLLASTSRTARSRTSTSAAPSRTRSTSPASTRRSTSSRGQVLDGLPPLIFIKALLPQAEIDAALKKVPTYRLQRRRRPRPSSRSRRTRRGSATTLNVPTGCAACLLLSQVLAQGASKIGIDDQPQHDAGAAAVPGHPRPQAEPRDPGARTGARLAAPDAVPRPALHERARRSRGTRTRRTTRTRRSTS